MDLSMAIYMKDKTFDGNAQLVNAILDVSKSYHDRQEKLKNAIDTLQVTTECVKTKYIKRIKKYAQNNPLIDLLPFDYLGPLKGTFYERAHTMILSFLLDPKYSGKYSKCFLNKILSKIERNVTNYDITEVSAEASLRTHNTSGMPDITIKLENNENKGENGLRIIIENKCMATESKDQTPKYVRGDKNKKGFPCQKCIKNNIDRKPECEPHSDAIYLFIDYKGREAKCPLFKSVNYDDIKIALKNARCESWDYLKKGKSLSLLIDHYIKSIENMGKDGGIVSYSDLESNEKIGKLNLLQRKYLYDKILTNNQKGKYYGIKPTF